MLTPVGGCFLLEEWECGYGGPGCTAAPGLVACSDTIALGAEALAMVTYYDDTGAHAAVIVEAASSDEGVLGVRRAGAGGTLALTGVREGSADLRVQVEGWDDASFRAAFVVARAVEGEGEGEGAGEGEGEGEGELGPTEVPCDGTLSSGGTPVFARE